MTKLWGWLKSLPSKAGAWVAKYPLAALMLLVTGATVLILSVFGRTINAGGLLGKLLPKGEAKRDEKKDRNEVPEGRKDGDGNPIGPGESDDQGFVQAPADQMKEPGIFDDDSSVNVKGPDGHDSKIPLPTGVGSGDVKDVIVIQPDARQTRNNDKGVDAGEVLDILKRRR